MSSLRSSSSLVAAVLIVLCLASKGLCACNPKDMSIATVRSGREYKGQPEWNVKVTNRCSCPVKTIVLSCQGFQSVEPISASALNKNGDQCLFHSGIQLNKGGSLSFSYAWNSPYHFAPLYILPMGC